jgi:tRNA pseudouridine55 synthase
MISDGIIPVDKDFGLSSFEVVSRVKKLLHIRKVGHTGTLDPQATGLMLIALGKATKIASYLSNKRKTYLAKIRLGQSRNTFDRFGSITGEKEVSVSVQDTEGIINGLKGDFEQLIPPFSAAHHEGQRMYKLAREGVEFPAKYRTVKIHNIKVTDYTEQILSIDIECSSGTYIRSIAHQLGEKLGCGAHLYSLRRTSVGQHSAGSAMSLRQLESLVKLKLVGEHIIPIHQAIKIPALIVDDQNCMSVQQGRDILQDSVYQMEQNFQPGDLIGIKDRAGSLLAIGLACCSSDSIRQKTVDGTKVFDYKRVI